jgi:Ca2+-binding EF-hand superfamily protein
MKSWMIVGAIAALAAVQVQGAEQAAGQPQRKGARKMQRAQMERPAMNRAAQMEKFDTDGDGKLSDAEKTTAREAMQTRRRAAREKMGEGDGAKRERMRNRFDQDGDGQLSEKERARARKGWLAKADTDGDGKVSPEERKAAREKMAEAHPAMKERMLKRFDKDGDGKLSDEERAEARKARAARIDRPDRPERPERPARKRVQPAPAE